MSKQEKIVCAAVKKWLGDEGSVELFVDYPSKYLTGDAQIGYVGYQKGFITNKNRFVDPVEAMKIAIEARQFEYLVFKDLEVRLLKQQKFDTQAKISERLVKEWIDIVSERGLEPEDLY